MEKHNKFSLTSKISVTGIVLSFVMINYRRIYSPSEIEIILVFSYIIIGSLILENVFNYVSYLIKNGKK